MRSVIEPLPWWPVIGDAVDRGDVDGAAGRVLGDVARGRVRCRGRTCSELTVGLSPEAARNSSVASTRRSTWPVCDVVAAAAVDVDARVGEHVALERLLAHQHDLADRGRLGVGAEERVALRGAVDRGRLEQLPAVEDRLRVDPRGAAAGRADLEAHVRGVLALVRPMRPSTVPPMTRAPLLQRLGDEVARVELDAGAETAGRVVGGLELEVAAGGRAFGRFGWANRRSLAGIAAGARQPPWRRRGGGLQALLDGPTGACAARELRRRAACRWRRRRGLGVALGELELAADLGLRTLRFFGDRVGLRRPSSRCA